MGRRGAGRGTEPDVEALLDELYATPPPGFVARRDEVAAAARAAGRAEDARRVRGALGPTLAAWAANLLLRSRPEESRQFLDLGRQLREAYRALDAAGLRELSAQRRRLVAALARQAAELAQEAGHRLSGAARQDVEATLHAVLADPDAAERWATGRLHTALTPPSEFPTGLDQAGGTPPRPEPARRPGTRRPEPAKDELAERRRARQEELARVRHAAREADRRLRDRRAEHADAEEAADRARARHAEVTEDVSAAEERLEHLRAELHRAEAERREAEERQRTAAEALDRAGEEARRAAREADRRAARAR
ncbi:hypothetical protein GCM10018785_30000 [Streptomyces longispororuber]|uniref:Uncharacterized protein n=1 Tax=Streptomyces longispororuber TaxID=68230 RepID=A0A919DM73_9ACTN|nr:hypothetical protein [Streptomyces longispororuber]GHE58783.1 hypothetical protein GCM10018785_30000 [Streptomyces longispororuber]